MIDILIFAVAYAIKGGSGNIFANWERVREKSWILDRLLDGKILSTLIVFIWAVIAYGDDGSWLPLLIPMAWLAAVSPSMGEEHGAIGYLNYTPSAKYRFNFIALDGYELTSRGRLYDVKKALQRGVWMGACFTLVTGNVLFIPLSLLFIPAVFFGQSLNRLILKKDGWTLAEPLIGALIGLGFMVA